MQPINQLPELRKEGDSFWDIQEKKSHQLNYIKIGKITKRPYKVIRKSSMVKKVREEGEKHIDVISPFLDYCKGVSCDLQ